MPEAPVDENYRLVLRQDNVRRAGEVLPVQPESIAHLMKDGADSELRFGILASDSGHVPAAVLARDQVGDRGPSESGRSAAYLGAQR